MRKQPVSAKTDPVCVLGKDIRTKLVPKTIYKIFNSLPISSMKVRSYTQTEPMFKINILPQLEWQLSIQEVKYQFKADSDEQ